MTQRQPWRLSIMLDAPDHDLAGLEAALLGASGRISELAGVRPCRLGVAVANTDLASNTTHDLTGWRTVDGAIEITIADDEFAAIAGICRAILPILAQAAETGSIEVMVGPMHAMVPARPGRVFLSLCFRRYPGTTIEQFREWWLNQRAAIAIPALGPELLAYDQVHVEDELTREAANALGVDFRSYDAYDNLTWADADAYARLTSDPAHMAIVAQDEDGRIDNASRRFALMRDIREIA